MLDEFWLQIIILLLSLGLGKLSEKRSSSPVTGKYMWSVAEAQTEQ